MVNSLILSLKRTNSFNNFFSSIGTDISNSVPTTNTDPLGYITSDENLISRDLGKKSQVHFCHIINSMLTKNSLDLDGISTYLIGSIAIEISVPLAHYFTLAKERKLSPVNFKLVEKKVLVFKVGDPEPCDNYRPISLLSSLSNILEKSG
jgi:hypothetical protein